jgi:hypothetical protein
MKSSTLISRVSMALQSNVSVTVSASIVMIDDGGKESPKSCNKVFWVDQPFKYRTFRRLFVPPSLTPHLTRLIAREEFIAV